MEKKSDHVTLMSSVIFVHSCVKYQYQKGKRVWEAEPPIYTIILPTLQYNIRPAVFMCHDLKLRL